MKIEGTCESKNFDETVRHQFEKRQEWIREIREERLQEIAEGMSSTPRVARSSAASFSGRNECPGTRCSLIEHEKKENSYRSAKNIRVKGKTEKKTGRPGQNESEREEKWQTCWC